VPGRPAAGQVADRRAAGGRARRGVGGVGDDQVGRGDVQGVAERSQHLKRQPFRGAGDQPVDLRGGQRDAALGQQRNKLGGGEQAAFGHQLAQSPAVADLSSHPELPVVVAVAVVVVPASGVALLASAAWTVASSAACSVRVRKSEDTQV
jgi:hypothetical protein